MSSGTATMDCEIEELKKELQNTKSRLKKLLKKKEESKKEKVKQLDLIIIHVLFSFDPWLLISSFEILSEIIGRARVCKSWNINTNQYLKKLKCLMIGNTNAICDKSSSKISFSKWFNLLLFDKQRQLRFVCNSLGQLHLDGKFTYEVNLHLWLVDCVEASRFDSEWLKVTLYHFPQLLQERHSNGSQLIHYAAQKNRLDLLKVLIDGKANLSINGSDNISTLSFALNSRNVDVCKLLLDNKVSLNNRDGGSGGATGWYPIHWSAKWSNLPCLLLLLQHNANPFVLTDLNLNVFDIAFNEGNTEVYKYLIEHFDELANEWTIPYTIEFRVLSSKKICFVLDENHFYPIPSLFADSRV